MMNRFMVLTFCRLCAMIEARKEEREVWSPVTIKDVAKLAGVSVGTVSNYFNAPDKLSPRSFEKVRKVVDQHGFQPNLTAKTMRTKETNMVAVVLPSITNPYYTILYDAIQKACFEYGYTPIVYTTENGLGFLPRLLSPGNGQVDGVILAYLENDVQEYLKNLPPEAPVVQLGIFAPESDISCVVSNLRTGMVEAVEHLSALGHSRIAYVENTAENAVHTAEKKNALLAGMEKCGIPYDETLTFSGKSSFVTGFAAAKYFMALKEPPTAIVAENDLTALGCLHFLNESGYKIPDDVAVVGFDDIWEASLCFPQLTTVHQCIKEIGSQAAGILRDKLRNPKCKNSVVVYNTSLVIRKSTDKNAPFSTYF